MEILSIFLAGAAAGGLWQLNRKRDRARRDPANLWTDRFPGDVVRDTKMLPDGRYALIDSDMGLGVVRIKDGAGWRIGPDDTYSQASGDIQICPSEMEKRFEINISAGSLDDGWADKVKTHST
ncbi:hypothetical protein [Palleronia caenipelagi]|uniref:Uncharacterized protein n=1 Tax=Palleronia caenipelagi TaxID=2489174 RepID=A0A547QAA4_9RHOB|nr:hypothetical protein [Palleronia caenipelagi]TRD23282.1 hypothetical protein FEV53_01615 [Palleronia caenipelagi]